MSVVLFVWVGLCRVGLGEVGLGRIGWFVRAARVHLVCMVYLFGLGWVGWWIYGFVCFGGVDCLVDLLG